jgi:hypothetical protein
MANVAYSPLAPGVSADEIAKYPNVVRTQTDGLGQRVGNVAEFTMIMPVKPGGAKIFRERAVKAQIEAGYWEAKLGTVHNVRIALINNDTQILFAATYSDEFKPYVVDVTKFATPWIDYMFMDAVEGFPGMDSPGAVPFVEKHVVKVDVWMAANSEATVRDVARAQKVSRIFGELLDAAQS